MRLRAFSILLNNQSYFTINYWLRRTFECNTHRKMAIVPLSFNSIWSKIGPSDFYSSPFWQRERNLEETKFVICFQNNLQILTQADIIVSRMPRAMLHASLVCTNSQSSASKRIMKTSSRGIRADYRFHANLVRCQTLTERTVWHWRLPPNT